jgi:hypothetical protein
MLTYAEQVKEEVRKMLNWLGKEQVSGQVTMEEFVTYVQVC